MAATWTLVATLVGVREGLEIGRGTAVLTVVLGWLLAVGGSLAIDYLLVGGTGLEMFL